MKLYAILGVSTTSNPAQIKGAYRRLAKKHHPDKGGDPAIFGEISRAYAVLSDPVKRAKYDATGDEGGADNSRRDILQLIAVALEGVISDLDRAATQNIPLSVREILEAQVSAIENSLRAMAEVRNKVLKLANRITPKQPGGEDVISPMIKDKITSLDSLGVSLNRQLADLRAAIAIVDGLDDMPEDKPAPPDPLARMRRDVAAMFSLDLPT